MIDMKWIRNDPEKVKENIRKKFQDDKLPLVDEVVELDQKFREAKVQGDELRSQRKSINSVLAATCWSMPVSTRLAKVRLKNGSRKEFEVRDSSIRMLNRASDTAMRRVRMPAMRTE